MQQHDRTWIGLVLLWLTIAAVPSVSYSAEPIRIDSLTFSSGQLTYQAEGIEVEDVNLPPESMEALLHGSDLAAQAKALTTLDASRINVSRLRETQTIGDQTVSSIYFNVSLNNIKAGIVGQFRVESSTLGSIAHLTGSGSGSTGLMTVDDMDLGLLIGFGGPAKDKKVDEFRRAYRHTEVHQMVFQYPNAATITVEQASGDEFQFRNIGDGLTAIVERLFKRQANTQQTDADVSASLVDVIDMLSSFSVGSLEFTNLTIKEAEKPQNLTKIGKFQYTGGLTTEASSFRIDGVDIAIDNFRMKLGSFVQSGIKLTPVFDGLRKALSNPNAKPQDVEPSLFLSLLGRIELHDAVIDTNLEGAQQFGARNFVFALETPKDAPPKQVELSFDGLYGPLPTNTADSTIQTLASLGYHDVNLSGGLKATLDAGAQELDFESTLSSQNMANVALSSRFGNVSAASLLANPSNIPAILLGASLKNFRVAIENRGLVERLIDQQAIKTKRTAEQVRDSYASAAAASLQIYLGMSENAKGLTKTLVSFINNPNRLMISGQSKKPAGVTLADTATGEGPAAILDLFDLQREPQ